MYVSIRRAKAQDYASDEIVRRASEELLPLTQNDLQDSFRTTF